MGLYLALAAVVIGCLGLAAGLTLLVLVVKLSRRFDKYEATIVDLKAAHSAGVKEVGERVAANQSLLRKRVDHLEDEIKRHSARIDLFKKQVSAEVIGGIAQLDDRISSLTDDDDVVPPPKRQEPAGHDTQS